MIIVTLLIYPLITSPEPPSTRRFRARPLAQAVSKTQTRRRRKRRDRRMITKSSDSWGVSRFLPEMRFLDGFPQGVAARPTRSGFGLYGKRSAYIVLLRILGECYYGSWASEHVGLCYGAI